MNAQLSAAYYCEIVRDMVHDEPQLQAELEALERILKDAEAIGFTVVVERAGKQLKLITEVS